MIYYSVILEFILYLSVFLVFLKKKELVILYLPFFFFLQGIVEEPFVRLLIWYFIITLFFAFCAYRANFLKGINGPAVLLIIYFLILYIYSHSMSDTRRPFFALLCLIGTILIIPNLYSKHGKDVIFSELYKMSGLVLCLFIGNVLISTATGYAPIPLYGRTTGILYGHMEPTAFMLIPLVLFIYLLNNIKNPSMLNLAVALVALAMVLLSFRRTALVTALLAFACFLFILLIQEDKKKGLMLTAAMLVMSVIGLYFTNFTDQFSERYESRFEGGEFVQRDEGRFSDHIMVYEDMFVYERYSPLFGFSFFNSTGNYGGGVHGDRSLHPDLPVIAHASGLLGVFLYLGMIWGAFSRALVKCQTTNDKVLWLFCLGVFLVFTLSGRITETAYAIGLFLVLFLPTANASSDELVEGEAEERARASV